MACACSQDNCIIRWIIIVCCWIFVAINVINIAFYYSSYSAWILHLFLIYCYIVTAFHEMKCFDGFFKPRYGFMDILLDKAFWIIILALLNHPFDIFINVKAWHSWLNCIAAMVLLVVGIILAVIGCLTCQCCASSKSSSSSSSNANSSNNVAVAKA